MAPIFVWTAHLPYSPACAAMWSFAALHDGCAQYTWHASPHSMSGAALFRQCMHEDVRRPQGVPYAFVDASIESRTRHLVSCP